MYKFYENLGSRCILGADISKRSTGITIINRTGIQYLGTYKINTQASDTLASMMGRLQQMFINKIREFGVTDIVYEDIFQGPNVYNNRLLAVFNTVFDTMKDEDLVKINKVKYINGVWKSRLKTVAKDFMPDGLDIVMRGRHKDAVKEYLYWLGYNFEDIKDDISDAFGMVICYVEDYIKNKAWQGNMPNFKVGTIRSYHMMFTDYDKYMDLLCNYPDELELVEIDYKSSLENTILNFYKAYLAHMILLIRIGSYRALGVDLLQYGVKDELLNRENLCVLVCKKSLLQKKYLSDKVCF